MLTVLIVVPLLIAILELLNGLLSLADHLAVQNVAPCVNILLCGGFSEPDIPLQDVRFFLCGGLPSLNWRPPPLLARSPSYPNTLFKGLVGS